MTRPKKYRALSLPHLFVLLLLALALSAMLTFYLVKAHSAARERALRLEAASALDSMQNALDSMKAELEQKPEDPQFDLDLLLQIDRIARENALTSAERDALTDALLSAYASSLNDAHTLYYTAEEYLSVTAQQNGSFVGIGVSVSASDPENGENGCLTVLSVYPDSPAEEIGIRVGDMLIAAEGVSFFGMSAAEAVSLILGEEGTSVTLTLLRDETEITVTATRRTVKEIAVTGKWLTDGIAYVRILDFSRVTAEQMHGTLTRFADADGFIFDLRGNPGGFLTALVDCLAPILPDGPFIHVNQKKEGASYHYEEKDGALCLVHEDGTYDYVQTVCNATASITAPCAVLIDEHSASAAEAFAAAVRDYAAKGMIRARLFGTTSYGKGTVQVTYKLANGGAFRLSIATYDPPFGANYHGVGIIPDETVFLREGLAGTLPEAIPEGEDAPLERASEWLVSQITTYSD